MLNSNLAQIYGYDTKNFNRQMKNNIEKFPEDVSTEWGRSEENIAVQKFHLELGRTKISPERYCFSLNEEEYTKCYLKSQNATSNKRGRRMSAIKVFTEQVVAMLSSVLTSDIAVNIKSWNHKLWCQKNKIYTIHGCRWCWILIWLRYMDMTQSVSMNRSKTILQSFLRILGFN